MLARLVEVWSEASDGTGSCSSGWVVGTQGVLTAAHAVEQPRLQVRLAEALGDDAWVDASVAWRHPRLDAALLEITPGVGQRWETPKEPSPRLAGLGSEACSAEVIGFPDAEVRPDGVRKPEDAPGDLRPAGGVRDEWALVAYDVSGSVPNESALWRGVSGAGVRDRHGRIVGIVAKARPDRQGRRLLVLPVEAIVSDAGFAGSAQKVGLDPVLEDRLAPLWQECVAAGSLLASGVPSTVGDVIDLGVLGVHRAVAGDAGDAEFPGYVKRDVDGAIAAALREAEAGGRRVVLIVGDSAAGKSRSAAHAACSVEAIARRLLIVPAAQGLEALLKAGVRLDDALIWLGLVHK